MHCRIQEIEEDSEAYYLAMEYALKPVEATCLCGIVGKGSQMDLEKAGWTLNKQVGEVCPQCTVVQAREFQWAFGRMA